MILKREWRGGAKVVGDDSVRSAVVFESQEVLD